MQVQTNTQTSTTSSQTNLAPPSVLDEKLSTNVPSSQTSQTQSAALVQDNFSEKDAKVKLKKTKSLVTKKQIPTVLGLLILFIALISGVLLFGKGTGVFAPRATPQTTPKNIRVSNVTDKTFTISFYTDESTIAFVKYGESEKSLDKQASDDRDQLSGMVRDYRLHHITVRSLEPGKNYFYVLGTGSSSFDNEGQPYTIITAAKPNQSPTNNQTVYGNVLNADGSSAEGAIVYVYGDQMGTLSNLIKSSGSWGISLANAFSLDKSIYATLTDDSSIEIKIQGIEPDLFSSIKTTIAAAQPLANLTLGQNEASAGSSLANDAAGSDMLNKEELLADTTVATDSTTSVLTESTSSGALDSEESSSSSVLQNLLVSEESSSEAELIDSEILNLNELNETQEASSTTITTTQPQIKATLPANTIVRVVIHSDTQIDETVQTDADGNLLLDVASLGQNLEPGDHTASYTYIDPITGKEVTKTYNFTVDPTADSRQLAAAATPAPTASIPYGSGNPYVPTITAIPTIIPTITTIPVSTNSTTVATTSGQYSAGSIGTTIALLFGGLFFILAGVWSYFLANSFEQKNSRS